MAMHRQFRESVGELGLQVFVVVKEQLLSKVHAVAAQALISYRRTYRQRIGVLDLVPDFTRLDRRFVKPVRLKANRIQVSQPMNLRSYEHARVSS